MTSGMDLRLLAAKGKVLPQMLVVDMVHRHRGVEEEEEGVMTEGGTIVTSQVLPVRTATPSTAVETAMEEAVQELAKALVHHLLPAAVMALSLVPLRVQENQTMDWIPSVVAVGMQQTETPTNMAIVAVVLLKYTRAFLPDLLLVKPQAIGMDLDLAPAAMGGREEE